MKVLTKYKCLICGETTDPQPDGYEYEVEETKDYVCDECKDAVRFVREIMSQQGVLVKDHRGCYEILRYTRAR